MARRPSTLDRLVALVRETSASIPDDVRAALRRALRRETRGSSAAVVLRTILDNCALAERDGTPLCQDTGTLTFFVDARLRRRVTPALLKKAVARATALGCLRKNTIDAVTGESRDDNCAVGAPVVHYVEGEREEGTGNREEGTGNGEEGRGNGEGGRGNGERGTVTLLMKGGGSENMSRQYSLPDATLGAGRDLEGVRRCVLDAVQKIQGYGCAPGILGVCIGGDRATGFAVAKEQLLRPLDEGEGRREREEAIAKPFAGVSEMRPCRCTVVGRHLRCRRIARVATGFAIASEEGRSEESETLARLEKTLLEEANSLGIGPMGLGGKTTLLGVKVAARTRVPASFFVTVAYMCWACRRRTIQIAS